MISPESDHHLIHFEIVTNTLQIIRECQNEHVETIPEVATYDFHSADEEKLQQALQDIDWSGLLRPENNIKTFKKKFAEGMIIAANEANVPQSNTKTETTKRIKEKTRR